jgi:flavin reductase (DIM6/NTAB) family NADH-FMN oxidoreductase RutF
VTAANRPGRGDGEPHGSGGHDPDGAGGHGPSPLETLLTSNLDAPLVVVTTTNGRERSGCVVGFHTQCSIEPGRFAVWLSKANLTYRVGLLAEHFAVHFLTEDDHDVAALFGEETGDEVDKFARCEWQPGVGGVPLLAACPHRFVGRRVALLDEGGDHVCTVLEPIEVSSPGPFRPLRHSHVTGLDAGHPAEDRPRPRELEAE